MLKGVPTIDRFMRSRKATLAAPPGPASAHPPTPCPAVARRIKPNTPPCVVPCTYDLTSPLTSPAKSDAPAKSSLYSTVPLGVLRESQGQRGPHASQKPRNASPESEISGLGVERECVKESPSPWDRSQEGTVQDTVGTSSSRPSQGTWPGGPHPSHKGPDLGGDMATHHESPSKRARDGSPCHGLSATESPSKRGRGLAPREAVPKAPRDAVTQAQRPASVAPVMGVRGPDAPGSPGPLFAGGSPDRSAWGPEESYAYVRLLLAGDASAEGRTAPVVQSAARDSVAGVCGHEETIALLDTPKQRVTSQPCTLEGLPHQSVTTPSTPSRTGGGAVQVQQAASHKRLPEAPAGSTLGRGRRGEVQAGRSRVGRKGGAKGSKGAHERPPGVLPLGSLQFGFTRSGR